MFLFLLPLHLFSSGLQKPPGREAINTSGQGAVQLSFVLVKRTWPGNQIQHLPFQHCLFPSHRTTNPEQGVHSLLAEWVNHPFKDPSQLKCLLIVLQWPAITLTSSLWQIRSYMNQSCFLHLLPPPFHSHNHTKLRATVPAIPAPQNPDSPGHGIPALF